MLTRSGPRINVPDNRMLFLTLQVKIDNPPKNSHKSISQANCRDNFMKCILD